jgi:single-strand DNA-binding protein
MAKGDNQVFLLGNLGSDPDIRFVASGTCVAKFSVATSRSWKDKNDEWQEEVEWHRVVIWGKAAESLSDKLFKGDMVHVVGRIHYDSYEKDGIKRYTTEIVADTVRPIKAKGADHKSHEEGENSHNKEIEDSNDFPF